MELFAVKFAVDFRAPLKTTKLKRLKVHLRNVVVIDTLLQ